jgi:hypothetical protein
MSTNLQHITGIKCTTQNKCCHVFSHTTEMRASSPFPQCALANRAADLLLEADNVSWKSPLRGGVQFAWCALGLATHSKAAKFLCFWFAARVNILRTCFACLR